MRRLVLALTATAVMMIGMAVPIAGTGLTLVNITCNDGTNISAQVDDDTLAGLVDAVQGMALYPAGLSCLLTQTPVIVGLGGVASAAPNGGYVIGSGRFQVDCPATSGTYTVNFGISAQTSSNTAGAVASGGSVNFTIPAGQCRDQGTVASAPTCLAINADQPKPPAGAWYAYLWSQTTSSSGSLTDGFPVGGSFTSGWKDTGNPGKQTSPDRLALNYSGSCPAAGSPDPDGSPWALLNGNVTISVAR
jgi:hypothetical protein